MSMVWPTLGSRTAKEQNRTELSYFDATKITLRRFVVADSSGHILPVSHVPVKARFHYTGPTGDARTRTDFVGDPRGPNGVSRRPGPQKSRSGPVGFV